MKEQEQQTESRSTINLHLGDCLEAMREMPDNAFELAIVDPPYGIGMDNSKKRTKPDRPNSYTSLYKDERYHKSDWDCEVPTKEYFDELFRVSKHQIIWGANYMSSFLPNGYGWIYWNKNNGDDNNFSDGEFAFSSKGVQSRHFKVSAFDNLRGGKDRIHPTQKPVKLYEWLLTNYAKEGDKILDSHLGSMSIAIACHNLKFDLDGWELDPDYYAAGVKRFEQHKKQLQLF
jgi:site-specific DNA-methyltransferase (adenine-specific)